MRNLPIILAALALPSVADAAPKIETKWDNRCNDNKYTLAIRARNADSYAVDMRLCLLSKNGRWTCWVDSNVQPGKWAASNWQYYICGADGEYFWSTRRAGSSVAFDHPPGYRAGF